MARVVVGLSGGVDSSVAAGLLKKKGYEVIGMTVATCRDPKTPWEIEEIAAAQGVADALGIPFVTVSAREVFEEKVVQRFLNEYFSGRTPNPCIVCNHYVKWASLLKVAGEQDAEAVATGHYAHILRGRNGRYTIRRARDTRKDQSYVLFMLSQEDLAHTILPLGEYEKPQIREIARAEGLPSADTPDSQDICFVSHNDYAAFLAGREPARMPGPGDYIAAGDGRVLGKHQGYVHYTIGQRKGLGIAAGTPLYVSEIRPDTNTVVLAPEDVYGDSLACTEVNFVGLSEDELPEGATLHCTGKIRYAHAGTPCTIRRTGDRSLAATFDEPVRAITPGQAAVFYDDEGCVLCGGWIQ